MRRFIFPLCALVIAFIGYASAQTVGDFQALISNNFAGGGRGIGSWSQAVGWITSMLQTGNVVTQPTTITASFLSTNFHSTFSDNFASPATICPNGTFSAACKWYNGTEQCCMSPTAQPGNVGGAMFPTQVGPNGPTCPYTLDPVNGGIDITLSTQTTTGLTPNFTTVFSGILTSVPSDHTLGFSQQYGYFEITAKVSPNVGTWPAFWMLSQSQNMEIDIMEQYGHDSGHYFFTVHDYANNILNGPIQAPSTVVNLSAAYHQYGFLWDAGNVSFYFDRVQQGTFKTPTGANQPMYVLFDMGCGGGWPTLVWPVQDNAANPSANDLNGAVFGVQSVNVWQHN